MKKTSLGKPGFLLLTSLAVLAFPASHYAQIKFERTYGGGSDDRGWSVQQTQDGGQTPGDRCCVVAFC